MLLHWGEWNDDRYVVMKADAMSRDPRRQRYDWHKRDIMPKCVVSLFGQVSSKSANQKQELPVVAMFVNGSGRNEQSL
jgi:hypothetical protein